MPYIPRVGAEIAGYRLESVLQRGGMSIVYAAEHMRMQRRVALKILAMELAEPFLKSLLFHNQFFGEQLPEPLVKKPEVVNRQRRDLLR